MEQIKLFLIIVLPFTPMVAWSIGKIITRNREENPDSLHFLSATLRLEPSLGLHAQPLFWFSIIIPFFTFLTTGYFAWQGYELNITAKGFETFLHVSKLPLSIWGLCLPLAILISRLHATIQTAEQISISSDTADRDIKKLNKEQYSSAKEHFIQLMNNHWKQTSETIAPEFKKMEFDAERYFSMAFSGSSAPKGLQPCRSQFYDNLDNIEKTFIEFMDGSEWTKNAPYVKTHLTRLAIYLGEKTSDADLVNMDKMFYNYIVIYAKAIPKTIETIENEHL